MGVCLCVLPPLVLLVRVVYPDWYEPWKGNGVLDAFHNLFLSAVDLSL